MDEKTIEQVQEDKIAEENAMSEFTPEQIEKAKGIVEGWRDEAMEELKQEFMKDYVDMNLVDKDHVVGYLKKWTEKYFDSIVNTAISFPRMIKTNQDVVTELETALAKMDENDEAYADLKATRMATINQIKTYKADITNRKKLFEEYKTILTQIKELL